MQIWQAPKRDYFLSILIYFGSVTSLFFLSRLILSLIYAERLNHISAPGLFLNGLHADTVTAAFLCLPILLLMALTPARFYKSTVRTTLVYIAITITFLIYVETCTYNFIGQYDVRPNRIFYEYLIYPREVLPMLIKMAPIAMLMILIEVLALPYLIYKIFKPIIQSSLLAPYKLRLLSLLILLPTLAITARGGLSPRPFNISSVSFSQNRLANELALNSGFSLFYSVYRERLELNPEHFYGKVDLNTATQLLQNRMGLNSTNFENEQFLFLREQLPAKKQNKIRNVVIFLQESLGAEYVGHLGGLPLTPNYDELAKKGLSFTQMYSTGTRTIRGIEAVLSSFAPMPGSSVVKREKSKTDFFTIAQLFKDKGCATEFIYGGRSNFDEMKSFMVGNGIDNFYDQPTFKDPVHVSEWGVSDEDLVRKANEVFKNHGDQCFFALILSTSSHSPFEFPDGRIKLYEQPKNTFNNAVKYADFAIGEFFHLAQKEKYYNNTIFTVVADHSTRVFGDEFVPIKKFHIPAVLIGPDVPKMAYTLPASQIDIVPTILNFVGVSTTHPSMGRNVLNLPAHDKGRAILQYYNNFAYVIGNETIILKPNEKPSYFTIDDFKLIPSAHPFDFLTEARSAAIMPWYLYNKKLHTLYQSGSTRKNRE